LGREGGGGVSADLGVSGAGVRGARLPYIANIIGGVEFTHPVIGNALLGGLKAGEELAGRHQISAPKDSLNKSIIIFIKSVSTIPDEFFRVEGAADRREMMLLHIVVLLVVCNIFLLPARIYLMSLTAFVSIFMLLAVYIGLLSNRFFAMFMVHFLMVLL
jgi:hypothetical protein